MVILFGSHARGDWVEDPETGYQSDYDILVIAPPEIARKNGLWADLSQRAKALAGRTPVRVIAHDIKEINSELRLGQYFFIDILREGVAHEPSVTKLPIWKPRYEQNEDGDILE